MGTMGNNYPDEDNMAVDKRTVSIHIRVSDESDALLELMRSAGAGGRAKADIAGELVEEALHGKGHALRLAALRYARLGLTGQGRE
jgi:hypothetical protein